MSYEDDGYVAVNWDDSTRDPDFVSWRVYRREFGETAWELLDEITVTAPTYEHRDWTARSGVPYEYSVVQVALRFDALVESDHDPSDPVEPVGTHYWLIHPSDEELSIKLEHVTADQFNEPYEESEMTIIGRGRRVDFGTRIGFVGTLTADLRDWSYLTAREQRERIRAMRASLSEFFLRNPFGDIWQVSMGDVSFNRTAGVGRREHMSITIPYKEVN